MNPSFVAFCLSVLLTGRIALAANDVQKHSMKMKKMVASATETLFQPMQQVDNGANSSDWGNATWFWLFQTHHHGKGCQGDKTFAEVINTFSAKCQGSKSPSLKVAGVKLPQGSGSARVRCVEENGEVKLQARLWDNDNCNGKWQDTTETLLNSADCAVETAGSFFGIDTGKLLGSASFRFGCAVSGDWPENVTAINDCYWATYLPDGYLDTNLTAAARCEDGSVYADAYAAFDPRTLRKLGLAQELGCGNAVTDKCRRDDMFGSGGIITGRAGNLTLDPTLAASNNDDGNNGAQSIEKVSGAVKWAGDVWSKVVATFA